LYHLTNSPPTSSLRTWLRAPARPSRLVTSVHGNVLRRIGGFLIVAKNGQNMIQPTSDRPISGHTYLENDMLDAGKRNATLTESFA
jgi:hypothetical protein